MNENIEVVKNLLNKVAKKGQIIHEGQAFECECGPSNISPTFTLSFTRPFYIDENEWLAETKWYKAFKEISKYKEITHKALKKIYPCTSQLQSLRYSIYLVKTSKGIYSPTIYMRQLVRNIEEKKEELFMKYNIVDFDKINNIWEIIYKE